MHIIVYYHIYAKIKNNFSPFFNCYLAAQGQLWAVIEETTSRGLSNMNYEI